jgi:hypothetical protein
MRRRMILLRHKGTVYGRLDRDQFLPSDWLLRLDPAQEPARSLWILGQYASQFFATRGYSVLVAQAQRHYTPPHA